MEHVSRKHDLLFHYTTCSGLKGILESQSLHATHYKYLNDASELHAIAPKLRELAGPAIRELLMEMANSNEGLIEINSQGGFESCVVNDVERVVDGIYAVTLGNLGRHKFYQPYIASFCNHNEPYERSNGLLSQWRGYGAASGYAIVFNAEKLEELLLREAASHAYDYGFLGDVVYAGDEEAFMAEFPNLGSVVRDSIRAVSDDQAVFSSFYSEFVLSASRFKHQGFKEEQEVRLCVSPRDPMMTEKLRERGPNYAGAHEYKNIKTILFKDNFVPYVNIFGDLEGRSLPIAKVIVGPHADKQGRRDRLCRYLEIRGIEIEVFCSETPFV